MENIPTTNLDTIDKALRQEIYTYVQKKYHKRKYRKHVDDALSYYQEHHLNTIEEVIKYLKETNEQFITEAVFFYDKEIERITILFSSEDIASFSNAETSEQYAYLLACIERKKIFRQEPWASLAYGHDHLAAICAVWYVHIRYLDDQNKKKEKISIWDSLNKTKEMLEWLFGKKWVPTPAYNHIKHNLYTNLKNTSTP